MVRSCRNQSPLYEAWAKPNSNALHTSQLRGTQRLKSSPNEELYGPLVNMTIMKRRHQFIGAGIQCRASLHTGAWHTNEMWARCANAF